MSNLLCVDFDFWFYSPMEAHDTSDPTWELYDWGHAETPLFLSDMIWHTRAASFLQHGFPLPEIRGPESGWETFWDRFTFADHTEFMYADSNAHAGLAYPSDGTEAFESVVLFDAHHDSGYRINKFTDYLTQDSWSCEDWMLEHQRRGTTNLTVRYPPWKPNGLTEPLPDGCLTQLTVDDNQPVSDTIFDTVFVCRSGAWVPAWCDRDFMEFINSAPFDGNQVDTEVLDRGFDVDMARRSAEQMRQMMEQLQSGLKTPME